MEEWKEYKISDVIDEISMGPFGSNIKVDNFIDTGVPVLNGSNLQGFKLIEDSFNYVSREKADSLGKANAHKGDIVITHRGTLGQIVYIPEDSKYDQYVISQSQFRIKLKQDIIRPDFFVYFFHTRLGQHRILMNASQVGVPALARPTTTFKEVLVPVPNMDIQNIIMDILHSLDDKIELNRRINENLEQQAQALFKSWFVDFEPFKDGEFVESELGRIPKGWRVGMLDELCSFISRGLTPKYDESSEELILGQTCVRNNIVTLNNARRHRPKTKNDKWVQQWDVLINSTGVGSLGRVGIVYFSKENVAIDSHITVVRTSSPVYRHYVGRNLLSRQLEIENMAVGSTGQTELPRDRVKTMPIIIPSHDALDKFNAIIEPMAISMYSNIMESRRLATLRDTLLPKLMSGELKVNEVEI